MRDSAARRKMTTLNSGHNLFQNDSEINHGLRGIAFIVNRQFTHRVT